MFFFVFIFVPFDEKTHPNTIYFCFTLLVVSTHFGAFFLPNVPKSKDERIPLSMTHNWKKVSRELWHFHGWNTYFSYPGIKKINYFITYSLWHVHKDSKSKKKNALFCLKKKTWENTRVQNIRFSKFCQEV